MVPNDIQSELKHLYVAVGELLRHFWSCFPVNTPFLEEKVVKMKSNLERFQVTKLCPFQEKNPETVFKHKFGKSYRRDAPDSLQQAPYMAVTASNEENVKCLWLSQVL